MMQGRGVTNFAADAPSHAFTVSTTEFDDELIRRNIVTKEQVFLAKGASATTVEKLLSAATEKSGDISNEQEAEASDDESFVDDEDDEFLQQYRQQRFQEISSNKATTGGFCDAIRIDRSEWDEQVNQASQEHWVVVCLSSSPCKTGCIETAVGSLARECSKVKFVVIEAKHAFDKEWPHELLPSLFLYRYGKMQKQLLSLNEDISKFELEVLLEQQGVE